jgi:MoaA/NifB/PqqE/SkfB family radical SAM enzyme
MEVVKPFSMQSLIGIYPENTSLLKVKTKQELKINKPYQNWFVTGKNQISIRRLMWLNILWISLKIFKNPFIAFKKVKDLRQLRDIYRNQNVLTRYAKAGERYFVSFNTPGWPSKAFNRFIAHQLNRSKQLEQPTLHTLVFAITKKCGFKCEHCCEWINLNKPETLLKEDLQLIVTRFHQLGIAQVQLSGGEPLNRLNDIYYLLDNAPKGIDFWLYSTGYKLTPEKARQLKKHGLTGLTISLDHHLEDKHDAFRGMKGAFTKALQAVQFARDAGLIVCFSLCATKDFISKENLIRYAELAKECGVSFIQILEPKAVGHYAGQDVLLSDHHQNILEQFFEMMNYHPNYSSYPVVTYHGYYSRRMGCSGSGKDYLYVDTDGDVHNCPFCQRKLFSALDDSLIDRIAAMKTKGCGLYNICSTVK